MVIENINTNRLQW